MQKHIHISLFLYMKSISNKAKTLFYGKHTITVSFVDRFTVTYAMVI